MTGRTRAKARVLAWAVLLVGVFAALPAFAQAIGFAVTPARRENQDNANNLRVNQINRADCLEGDTITYTLNVSNIGGGDFQIQTWVAFSGADCTLTENHAAGTGQCRQVAPEERATTTTEIEINVRDLVSNVSGPWTGPAGDDVCTISSETSVTRKVYFLLYSGGSIVEGGSNTQEVTYDLLGPDPPTSVRAGIGERVLVVSWKEPSSTDIARYRIYTDALTSVGDAGTDDAGVDEAGTDDGGAGGAPPDGTSSGCTSDELIPGQPPPAGKTHSGETTSTTTQAEARGLRNGVRYAVAVASVDDFYNSGNLSRLVCATPEPVTGFFEAYRATGGGAGGGYCALGATPSRTAAAGVVLAALALVFRRRRRATRTNERRAA